MTSDRRYGGGSDAGSRYLKKKMKLENVKD